MSLILAMWKVDSESGIIVLLSFFLPRLFESLDFSNINVSYQEMQAHLTDIIYKLFAKY